MSPERFRQIEELYHAAREATAGARAALLARADPELRREVESLFAQRSGGEFLERPAIRTPRNCRRMRPSRPQRWGLASGLTASKANSARAAWERCFGR